MLLSSGIHTSTAPPGRACRSRSTASVVRRRATVPTSSATAATRRVCRSTSREPTRSCSTSVPGFATSDTPLPTGTPFRGSCLVSHLHWDHIQGLPFFTPLLTDGAHVTIYAPAQDDGRPSSRSSPRRSSHRSSRSTWRCFPARSNSTGLSDDEFVIDGGPAGDIRGDVALDPARRSHARLPHRVERCLGGLSERSSDAVRRLVRRHRRSDRTVSRRRPPDPRRAVHRRRVRREVRLGTLHDRVRRLDGSRGRSSANWRCSITTRVITMTNSTDSWSERWHRVPNAASASSVPARASPCRSERRARTGVPWILLPPSPP